MNKRPVTKAFVHFLCLSFLSLMGVFPGMAAETKDLPIGEMVSKGEVKLDVSKSGWETVPSSHYSTIFPGTKVKTEKGVATVRLSDNSQIGIYSNSSFSFDHNDRFTLLQGSIEFYVPPASELTIQAGNISILKSRVQQAGKNPSAFFPKDNGDTFGSISIQSTGSVTVRNGQGKISILNPDNTVLASLASKESVTISATEGGKLQVAQATKGETATTESGEFLGLSTWEWVGAGGLAVAIGVGAGVAIGSGGGGGAVCP